MRDKPGSDKVLLQAVKIAQRAFASLEKIEDEMENGTSFKKRYRIKGGGSKPKAKNIRESLFDWFIDVRTGLKGNSLAAIHVIFTI